MVTIDNVSSDEGRVIVTLHDESTFMKVNALQTKNSEVKNGKITVTFGNGVPGTYGVLAVYDKQ